jgi:hypothetical protein
VKMTESSQPTTHSDCNTPILHSSFQGDRTDDRKRKMIVLRL